MDVPSTVTTALADRPVEGAVCLEAGAGVGNTSAGLLAAGADRVYAVTNDDEHAAVVRERVGRDTDRIAVIEADLGSVPLADDSVGVVTAHGLFNVLDPPVLEQVVAELTRVAAPGCHLVVDDYEPLPDDAAVADLFAVENAATQLTENRPALTFYPAPVLRRLLVGLGWEFDREWTLLDPVPWTASHLEAHANATRSAASGLPDDLGERLTAEANRLATAIGGESAGRMYSIALGLPA